MKKTLITLIQSASQFFHLDSYSSIKKRRFIIHTIILWWCITITRLWSAQEEVIAVLAGIITISYLPFITIELYQRKSRLQRYRYWGILISIWWTIWWLWYPHILINSLRSRWFMIIWRRVWDYCTFIRRRNTWNIYNQVSTIGVFLISIIFAIITMWRFQSINFNCNNINFLSTQFFGQVVWSSWNQVMSPVAQVVSSGWRSNYLQLLDSRLATTSGDTSLSNTIKQQVRNSVIVVMDQKKLYDNSVCDYVTTALNENYQKPSFFYSWVLLLTFIWLPAARIALIIIASFFSLILRWLHRLGIYRSHTTLVEHEVLE